MTREDKAIAALVALSVLLALALAYRLGGTLT